MEEKVPVSVGIRILSIENTARKKGSGSFFTFLYSFIAIYEEPTAHMVNNNNSTQAMMYAKLN